MSGIFDQIINYTPPVLGGAGVVNAGSLTGTTLAANVTASSLTSLGTIANLTATAGTIATTPSSSTDIANKLYVDTIAQGLDAKASCRVATTANITLSGTQTIDGISVVAGNRVLVKNQTLSQNNGIYICDASTWTRATDANTWDSLVSLFVFVERGTVNADSGYVCTVDEGGTLGTTAVTFVQFSSAGSFSAGNGLTLTGSVFSLTTPVSFANGGTNSSSGVQAIARLTGYTTTVTSATAVTLTNTSTCFQAFTGSTAQTVNLPVTSTLELGWKFVINNKSTTANVTVNSSGGNSVLLIFPGMTGTFVCIGTTLTTAADWNYEFSGFQNRTGSGSVVLASNPIITGPTINGTTTLGSTPVITTSSTTDTLPIGNTAGTGTITLGRSTASQTLALGGGITASGNTNTIQIGTAGAAGSTTAITLGGTANTSSVAVNGALSATGAIRIMTNNVYYAGTTTGGANQNLIGIGADDNTAVVSKSGNTIKMDAGGSTVGTFSSAGLAVTGALSATGILSGPGFRASKTTATSGLVKIQDEGANVYNVIGSRNNADSAALPLNFQASNFAFNGAVAVTGALSATGASGNTRATLTGSGGSVGSQLRTNNDYGDWFFGVAGDTSGNGIIYTANADDLIIYTNNSERMRINSAGALKLSAYGAGALTTDASGNVTAASDERIKSNIRPFSRGLAEILAINPILHGYTEESGLDQTRDDYAGFSAQQVQPLIPEAIGENSNGMLSFSDRPVMAALVNAMKELNANLVAELQSVRQRLAALEA